MIVFIKYLLIFVMLINSFMSNKENINAPTFDAITSFLDVVDKPSLEGATNSLNIMGSKISGEKSAAKKIGITWDEWKEKVNSGLLWCYHCKTWKEKDCFCIDKSRWSGRNSACKPCNSQRSIRSKYRINKEKLKQITNEICPICERTGQKMEVDHNHKTGEVRETLCSRCNGALGQFCDDIILLKKAIKYLEKHNE